MAADNEAHNNESTPLDDDVLQRLAEIDASLADGLDSDERIQSGVPLSQRASDIDFIQMSGLTRAFSGATNQPREDKPDDLSDPIDFFEKGVADVDAGMAPADDEEPESDDPVPIKHEPVADIEPSFAPTPAPTPQEDAADPEPVVQEDTAVPEPIAQEDTTVSEPVEHEEAPAIPVLPQMDSVQPPDYDEPQVAQETIEVLKIEAANEIDEGASTSPVVSERRSAPPDLAEAEQLLQALEGQIPDKQPPTDQTPIASAGQAFVPPMSFDGYEEEPPKNRASAPPAEGTIAYPEPTPKPLRRHSRKSRDHNRRRLIRWTVRMAAAVILVAAVFSAHRYFSTKMATPEEKMGQAQSLLESGDAVAASRAFEAFAASFPNNPLKVEAQFLAANALQQANPASSDEEQANLTHALALYEQFLKDNPGSNRAGRARTLMGQINYKLQRYEEAINILRNPTLVLQDSDATLPALRTLARAYTQMGEYAAAESAYLQAASLIDNCSPDVDYVELGNLFKLRADRADSDEDQKRFNKAAIEQWTYATRVPTIDPANKTKIQEKCDALTRQMNGMLSNTLAATPQDDKNTANAASMDLKRSVEAAPSESALPAEQITGQATADTAEHEPGPSPQEEAEYLQAPVVATESALPTDAPPTQ